MTIEHQEKMENIKGRTRRRMRLVAEVSMRLRWTCGDGNVLFLLLQVSPPDKVGEEVAEGYEGGHGHAGSADEDEEAVEGEGRVGEVVSDT